MNINFKKWVEMKIDFNEKLKEYAIKRNPFNRLTTPEDVANVVYLLTTEESKWITGVTLPVNGGEHLS